MTSSDYRYPYDIALSFAGEDRSYAGALANILQREGVKVFYDKYEKATLWGQDLYSGTAPLTGERAQATF